MTKAVLTFLTGVALLGAVSNFGFKVNPGDWVFIKNEAPFKLDLNKLFSKVYSIFFSDRNATRSSQLPELEASVNKSAILNEIQMTVERAQRATNLSVEIATSSNNTLLYLLIGSLAAVFALGYKYFKLKKQADRLFLALKSSHEITKNCKDLLALHRDSFLQNRDFALKTIDNFNKGKEKLMKAREEFNNEYLEAKLSKYQRNFCKIQFLKIDESFKNVTQLFEKKAAHFAEMKLENIIKTRFLERSFSMFKSRPSFLIAAGMNFILMYALIDFGLTDLNQANFITNIGESYFPYSEFDTGLSVVDFERPSVKLRFDHITNHTKTTEYGIKNSRIAALKALQGVLKV